MGKKNQGSIRQIASLVAVVAVLGYIGSYGPSVMSWWEETWYPHGREPTVIQPGQHPDPIVLNNASEPNSAGKRTDIISDLPMMMDPEQVMPPPVAQSEGTADENTIDVEDANGCYVMPESDDYLASPIAHADRERDDLNGV